MIEDNRHTHFRFKEYYLKIKHLIIEYPIISNLIFIIIVGLIIIRLVLMFLDNWTLHGVETVIPDVKGKNILIGKEILNKEGLQCAVADSIFDNSQPPGTIIEQNPHAMSKVKPGRTVYMTIVAYSPKMIFFPDIANMSLRQAQSMLEGLGLKRIIINRVPSEYRDLVLSAANNGRELRPGEKIPITSVITLEVGEGIGDDEDIDIDESERLDSEISF